MFADVDPRTGNVTASSIEQRISERTRGIIVTHLFGNPCDMGDIEALGRARHLPIIEDCAQAVLARYDRRQVGTFGTIACFSLQQGKHLTCGEGGLVATTDAQLARRIDLFINKGWSYGDAHPDHCFLALNYRMSELQGAVAVAQLRKLPSMVGQRILAANRLTDQIQAVAGIRAPWVDSRSVHTYWRYPLIVDSAIIQGGAHGLASALKEHRIPSAPGYLPKPAFMCEVFQTQRTFGRSHHPFNLARGQAVQYDRTLYPGVFNALDNLLVLPWTERYSGEHVDYIARSIQHAARRLSALS